MIIYNFIRYIHLINEGLLKTTPADIVLSKSNIFLNPLKISYNINYDIRDNKIILEIINFNKVSDISNIFNCVESFFINMNGWFPSYMSMVNISGMINKSTYNKEYLVDMCEYLSSVEIIFESKFDIESEIPAKLYHLTIQHFENKISKIGIYPRSKSKLTQHPDRIYLCCSIQDCENLIPQMSIFYRSKLWQNKSYKIDSRWAIYEVDTKGLVKLYKDPNYLNGYYILENIPPQNLRIVEKE